MSDCTIMCLIIVPSQVPEAVCLPGMTYHEAWEMSYFGANVLHPRTTLPAMKYKIPITIRNFFRLDAPGKSVVSQCGGGQRQFQLQLPTLNHISQWVLPPS